jgi:uncharacterized protein YcnI
MRSPRIASLLVVAVALASIPSAALAHVTIAPNQSMAGATEKYVVRVPTEGKVATVAAELEVPEGMVVETLAVPNGWKHELKREGDRIVGITWTMSIPPGEFAEFAFVARNPRDKDQVVWTLRQRFADGTVRDFTKGQNGIRPTAVTKFTPRPSQ